MFMACKVEEKSRNGKRGDQVERNFNAEFNCPTVLQEVQECDATKAKSTYLCRVHKYLPPILKKLAVKSKKLKLNIQPHLYADTRNKGIERAKLLECAPRQTDPGKTGS